MNKKRKSPFRVNQRVEDKGYGWWGLGIVTKVLKTRIHIMFPVDDDVVYDKAHYRFLRKRSK